MYMLHQTTYKCKRRITERDEEPSGFTILEMEMVQSNFNGSNIFGIMETC